MLVLTLMAALAVQTAAPAPTSGAAATLLQPREIQLNLDGRNWSCGPAGQCAGRGGGTTQPLMRECRRFVGRMGAVSAFARAGLALTEAEIARCNAADNARAPRNAGPA
ncbi:MULTISPECIES: hypothetical protein [unclassified Brevundimonas]|uniref:CC_3452 family protein n=1 Tax=unclassified Brevundimonas TaxID=2622653 RepID=UPI0006FDFCA2|nr:MULTISPECIES: hypothetical protein [unclassified Brevundimonas]KQY86326.1 hypothetical protein ASD25_23045 [Brevundimonas sp. Root1423]KRA26534.1 hypothetical protein ASD59_08630 [Brevundimonas sp. Root608]